MNSIQVGTVGSPAMLTGNPVQRRALIQQVEDAGIDHLFVADHVSFHTGLGMDGIVNTATLTAMSDSLRVIIGVYLLALRHPVPVARQLSSLAQSAPGRVVLGVGVGGEDRHEMEVCGVDPARRGRHTDHALAALRQLMRGDPVSYNCDFFSFEQALIKPAPDPVIPVMVGGRSDRAITRAAMLSEGWLGVWCSPERYGAVVESISRQALEARADQPVWQHGLQVWTGFADSRAQAREYVAREMEAIYHIPFERFEKYSPYGSPEEVAAFLSRYIDQGARVFNIKPCAGSEAEGIAAVAEVRRLMQMGL